MNILVACEESQAVTIELRKLGHNAFSCDIIECSGGHPEWHIMQDVLPLLNGFCHFKTCDGLSHYLDSKWDMLIAFPPCTYISNAGACRMFPRKGEIDKERFAKAMEAKAFFMAFHNADCEKISIENPVPLRVVGLPEKTQVIQPYEFGHPFTKKTYLWLKGLKNLTPTEVVEPLGPYVCGNSEIWKKQAANGIVYGKEKSAKHRSKTFPGIAKAMAEQWAGEIKEIKEREVKEMKLKMKPYNPAEQILFNYEELKAEIQEKAAVYATLVYTDETIKEAKADKANLNKLKKALNDERIKREKEYMQPFNDFKAKINELIRIIDEPVRIIDKQIKEAEEAKKREKLEKIKELFKKTVFPDWLNLERIWEARWLNATVSLKCIEDAMKAKCEAIESDLVTLSKLPEYAFEAIETYKTSLDLRSAMNEAHRLSEMAKRKVEAERIVAERKAEAERLARERKEAEEAKKAEEIPCTPYGEEHGMKKPYEAPVATVVPTANVDGQNVSVESIPVETPQRMWVSFRAHLTTDEAFALKAFFNEHEINFEAI